MTVSSDMSTPVTRGELRFEIEQSEVRLEAKLDQKFNEHLKNLVTKAEFKADLERFATKADLERFATKADLERFATKADLNAALEIWAGALMEQMTTEFARHARAFQEWSQTAVSAVDEKYAELPRRVKRLETKVFEPRRR